MIVVDLPQKAAISDSPTEQDPRPAVPAPGSSPSWLGVVEEHVRRLRFGSVGITVHEGRVVQIETSSKIRLG